MNGLSAEYKVHVTLATNAKKEDLDSYFIWQSPVQSDLISSDKLISYDFGRDMSIKPKPSSYRRFGMVMRRLPQTVAFLILKVKQIRPDFIYTSQQSFDVYLASILAKIFRIPHIIHLHYSVGPWLGKQTLNTIRKSSRLIAVSEYTRQTALLQGVLSSAIHTVINPTPILQFQPNSEYRSIRDEFNLDHDTPLVLAVGRLDPGKGHLDLFEAFSQVVKSVPNARLLICGSSTSHENYEGQLRQRVNELQINPYTIFAGQRNNIPAIMRSANVFCLPTELDPCPLVFLEAMTEGLPVAAYYSGGVPEMVLHSQTGLLSYPGDIQMLAMNIRTLLSDTAYAQRLGEAGKKRAAREFNPAVVVERWLNVLQAKTKS
jgi:D-inositol-3-phosphate glycosyltransferase